MKYVKFVWSGYDVNDLTLGKIYEVIEYNIKPNSNNNTIIIIDDRGVSGSCYLRNNSEIYFIDATAEYRKELIEGILK